MSVQGVTALIVAITGLVTAATALWHSIGTRKAIIKGVNDAIGPPEPKA